MKILLPLAASLGTLWVSFGLSLANDQELTVKYDPASEMMAFTNHTDADIRILRPLDGSEWCWIYPHYKFEVTDSSGNKVKPGLRCGNFGYPYFETQWPDDYLIVIPPNGTKSVSVMCPMKLREGATYTISVEYVFTKDARPTSGYPYPKNLWVGSIRTATVTYSRPASGKSATPIRSRDESEDPFK